MNKLQEILNDIDFDGRGSVSDLFIEISVSHFTHSLSGDEYLAEEIICFADVGSDPEKIRQFINIEKRFLSLYSDLYEASCRHVSLILDGIVHENIEFSVYSKAVSSAMRENPLYNFYFHDIGLYAMTGYDLTHSLYLFKSEEVYLTPIKSMIKKAGLNIL